MTVVDNQFRACTEIGSTFNSRNLGMWLLPSPYTAVDVGVFAPSGTGHCTWEIKREGQLLA